MFSVELGTRHYLFNTSSSARQLVFILHHNSKTVCTAVYGINSPHVNIFCCVNQFIMIAENEFPTQNQCVSPPRINQKNLRSRVKHFIYKTGWLITSIDRSELFTFYSSNNSRRIHCMKSSHGCVCVIIFKNHMLLLIFYVLWLIVILTWVSSRVGQFFRVWNYSV